MLGRCLHACLLSTCAGLVAEDRRWSPAALWASQKDQQCDREYDLQLSQSRLTYTNLGGAGPDVGRPRGIVFSSIFEKAGMNIDMAVTARKPYYSHDVSGNKVNGEFLGVSIDDGATATLLIHFLDPRTNTPVKIPRVTITLADLTAPTEGGGAKSVNVSGVHSYQAHPHTTLRAASQDGVMTFTATSPALDLPPLYSKDMSTQALRQAVSLQFRDVDVISLNLTAQPGNASRIFHIGGLSNLVCPSQAMCDTMTCPAYYSPIPTSDETYCAGPACNADDYTTCCEPVVPELCKLENLLMFPTNSLTYSNLGGLGPDFDRPPNILYSNVFPASGSEVDLIISNTSEYTPADFAANGLYGHRARLSVAANSKVSVRFLLRVKSESNKLLKSGFHFTVFDLDEEADGNGVEQVHASGFSSYQLANDSLIAARAEDESGTVFTATKYTHAMRANIADLDLTKVDLNKEVSFLYPPGRRSFDMTFSVSHGKGLHSFLFTGFSTLPCPAQATCRKYECPDGMRQKPARNSILCAASECTTIDETTCCELAEPPADPASCDNMNCPGNSRLKPFASELKCKWDECTAEDAETCCIFYETEVCSIQKQLVLNTVAWSNLGGAGPDVDSPEGILYKDVFPGGNKKIDLRVRAAEPGTYGGGSDVRQNGLVGALGSISVPMGASMLFNFTFVESGTAKEIESIWPFTFTMVGLDAGIRGAAQQGVNFPDGVQKYSLTDFSNIDVSGSKHHPHFVAARRPDGKFDPDGMRLHPYSLTPEELESSVNVMMDHTHFQLRLSVSSFGRQGRTERVQNRISERIQKRVSQNARGNFSRTFLFAGATSMTCSQMTPCSAYECPAGYSRKTSAPWTVCRSAVCNELDLYTCCDCDDVNALHFAADSLVSSTFDEGYTGTATFRDVFPNSGHKVRLQISSTAEYYANNGSATGLDGEFMSINLRAGAEEAFKFKFFLDNGEPYAAPSFFFSVFDLDRQRDGGAIESVSVTNTVYHKLTEPSAVVYNDDTDAFVGTVRGTYTDNPSNPMALTKNHLMHSIAFLMEPRTSEFTVGTSVTGGWFGRNIMFGGSSNIVCPERALCTKANCPSGMQLRKQAARMTCKHHVCLAEDIPKCCMAVSPPSTEG